MNEAQLIKSIDAELLPQSLAELRPYVGVASKEEVDLSSQVNELFKQLSKITDPLVASAIEAHTAADFTTAAMASFNAYVRALRVKSDLLHVILKNDLTAAEQMVNRSLNGLEFSFKDNGTKQFGSALTEQAEFAIWTRRKTFNLVWRLIEPSVLNHIPSAEAKEDSDTLYAEFAIASAWSQFHLECLTTAMRLGKTIYPNVAPAIVEGLRVEVNAYAIAKQMVDLYLPSPPDEQLVPYNWSEEDEELLASSMKDMESEQLEEY